MSDNIQAALIAAQIAFEFWKESLSKRKDVVVTRPPYISENGLRVRALVRIDGERNALVWGWKPSDSGDGRAWGWFHTRNKKERIRKEKAQCQQNPKKPNQ